MDVDNTDYEKYPRFEQVDYIECILQQGEILYIPVRFYFTLFIACKKLIYNVLSQSGGTMLNPLKLALVLVSGFKKKKKKLLLVCENALTVFTL